MSFIVFIPALLCILALSRWGVKGAFLNVSLPILLLCPTYFSWKTGGFPGLDFGIMSFLPLGIALAFSHFSQWKLTRSDIWLSLFIATYFVAELGFGRVSLAKYQLFNVIATALIPYMVGKILIEQEGIRTATVRRIVVVLCATCIFAIPEFFIKMNLFLRAWIRFFPGEWPGWVTQIRWGFGRVAGPFGSAEIAGMIFIIGLVLSLWLRTSTYDQPSFRWLGWWSFKTVNLVFFGVFLLALIMTQSRGPLLGAIIAIPIAFIGRAPNVPRRALVVAILYLVIGIPFYLQLKEYAAGPRTDFGSEQETAQYRAELLQNYIPIAQAGGAWGWGMYYPKIGGQLSVDNEFLRVYLVQGYLGLGAFVLLMLEASYTLLRTGLRSRSRQNSHLCFSLFGILAGWILTLCTVYLGTQSYQMFFLMIGWAQAIPLGQLSPKHQETAPLPVTATAENLIRVYT